MLKVTAYKRTAAATVAPVSLEDVTAHLRIAGLTDSYEDTLIEDVLIPAAVRACEEFCRISLLDQTYVGKLDRFDDEIILPKGPLISVTSIAYLDDDGNPQTLDASTYDVDTFTQPGRILLAYNKSWPSLRQHAHQVTVTWKAGYGTVATAVPESLKHGLLMLIGHWYDHRDTVDIKTLGEDLPWATKLLFEQFQMVEVR